MSTRYPDPTSMRDTWALLRSFESDPHASASMLSHMDCAEHHTTIICLIVMVRLALEQDVETFARLLNAMMEDGDQ